MTIYKNSKALIGKTPLLKLKSLEKEGRADIYVKVEKNNLAGSIKDRIALYMIEEAEKLGKLREGYTIVEPTSGNTGVALAALAATKGYKCILTMPASMSEERSKLAEAYGAEVIRTTEGALQGAVNKAKELSKKDGYFMPDQFSNPANIKAHYETTAVEILDELTPDAFIAGVGTGGTVSGVGKRLKEVNENAQVYAIEPAESPLLSGGKASAHKIQGIGGNFIPKNLNYDILDGIVDVKSDEAINMSRQLAKDEALAVGISSGANVVGAIKIADKLGEGKKVVTVLPDTGERYLSTKLYELK
ncbi:cysteine synthase A [Anaerococcus porci]|uniref:Cysteine synthase n=1 Tax=Anaerococcus porci TaxID=2652269 RepID=A0A6N7VBW8_9FIRM|nr:cysteine synthase A [Anaerococcus porci]MDY3005790.1 cysteine synthase A [Anaerococcus porci]MSS76928.1 cysteine synthase A [Anaerococcus porci]